MRFIFSTTNNIEGGKIIRYIDVICTNIVVGTNVFSDFAASFTDFFGGKSNSYKKKLNLIYNEAKKELKQKAVQIGANCVVGFQVDFDEISGKDKSMFMVSASGTACYVEYSEEKSDFENSGITIQSEVDKELFKREIIENLNNSIRLRDEWIEVLIETHPKETIIPLVKSYERTIGIEGYKNLCENIERVISSYPKEEVVESIYEEYIKSGYDNGVYLLMEACRLFDSGKILQCIKNDCHKCVSLLALSSDSYKKEDIPVMEEIIDYISKSPNTGKVEMVKSGFISKKEEEMYVCQNGHKNQKDAKYCSSCNLDIKGFTEEQNEIVDKFRKRIDVIRYLLNE